MQGKHAHVVDSRNHRECCTFDFFHLSYKQTPLSSTNSTPFLSTREQRASSRPKCYQRLYIVLLIRSVTEYMATKIAFGARLQHDSSLGQGLRMLETSS